jgi:hypothetical protein
LRFVSATSLSRRHPQFSVGARATSQDECLRKQERRLAVCVLLDIARMNPANRPKARPLLLAAAGAATLVFAGCGDGLRYPSGNLLASAYDASVVPDLTIGPSGNLLVAPFDMSSED